MRIEIKYNLKYRLKLLHYVSDVHTVRKKSLRFTIYNSNKFKYIFS